MAFSAGSDAHRLSTLPDAAVKAMLLAQLHDMMPALPTDPDLPHFVRTAWDVDPFALCSYSFLAVGASPADRRALTVPVHGDVLWLAGEHTSEDYPSTVRGAFESGQRAARSVVAALHATIASTVSSQVQS
jgi:monoamine oxidase